MNISRLNQRLILQKNVIVPDAWGNRLNDWVDWYACSCSAGEEGGTEAQAASMTTDEHSVCFTIRWCGLLNGLTPDGYRVLFNGELYNIQSIDHMRYRHRTIKLRCRKERR